MKVIIDYREKSSGIDKELVKRGIDIEYKQLDVADFIVGDIAIERKTKHDFINSMIDKRMLSQLTGLKDNFEKSLIILEGEENIYTIRNMHPNAIRGMLSAISIDYKIPIIPTRNHRDTAALIAIIAKRFEKKPKEISLLARKKPLTLKQMQQLIIECLPGVGPHLAKSLLKDFKSVKSIVNSSEKRMQKVEKIGKKKAKAIFDVINANYEEDL